MCNTSVSKSPSETLPLLALTRTQMKALKMPQKASKRQSPEAALETVQAGPVWSEIILFFVASRKMTNKYSLCLRAHSSSAASSQLERRLFV